MQEAFFRGSIANVRIYNLDGFLILDIGAGSDSAYPKIENPGSGIPNPFPGPNKVLIDIKAGALNHLDLWVRGGIPGVSLPLILGSDGSGIVAEKGADVNGFSIGDEVMINPLISCGECDHCAKSHENLCISMGVLGESCDGIFAEKIIINERSTTKKILLSAQLVNF